MVKSASNFIFDKSHGLKTSTYQHLVTVMLPPTGNKKFSCIILLCILPGMLTWSTSNSFWKTLKPWWCFLEKILSFCRKALPWCGSHFARFTIKQEVVVPCAHFVKSAQIFLCLTTVPASGVQTTGNRKWLMETVSCHWTPLSWQCIICHEKGSCCNLSVHCPIWTKFHVSSGLTTSTCQ